MDKKHTQGKWEVITKGEEVVIVCKKQGGDNLNRIATCNTDWPSRYRHYEKTRELTQAEVMANAQLIAMAPQMLECLTQLLKRIKQGEKITWGDECFEASKVVNEALGNPCPF